MPNFLAGNIRSKRNTDPPLGWSLVYSRQGGVGLSRLYEINGGLVWLNEAQGYAYSNNGGRTWVQASVGFNIQGIAYGAGTYVAVGTSPHVATAPSLAGPWTTRTTPVGSDLGPRNVHFANGIFMAPCYSAAAPSYVITSPDGITWTKREVAIWTGGSVFTAPFIAFDGTYWYANCQTSSPTGNVLARSDDNGLTWVDVTPVGDVPSFYYLNPYTGRLFAGGLEAGSTGVAQYSDDGGNSWVWNTPAGNDAGREFAGSKYKLLVKDTNSSPAQLWLSLDDGATYTLQTSPWSGNLTGTFLYHRGRFFVAYQESVGGGVYDQWLYEWETY